MNSLQIPSLLLNHHYDDRYFDVIDAFQEAKYIHIYGNHLISRLSEFASIPRTFAIAETGFGAARTLAALIDELNNSALDSIVIDYYTVELHPLEFSRMQSILEQVKGCSPEIVNQIIAQYSNIDITIEGWHHFAITASFG